MEHFKDICVSGKLMARVWKEYNQEVGQQTCGIGDHKKTKGVSAQLGSQKLGRSGVARVQKNTFIGLTRPEATRKPVVI